MKKAIILLGLLSLSSLYLSAQEFMGIKVEGGKQEIITSFKEKGFTVSSNKDNLVIVEGSVNGSSMEVYCSFTPKTNKCWKFTIFLPKRTSWYSLKSEYEKYLQIFTEKYGKPDKTYSFFSSPYYEGDGYEMSAVALEKSTYCAFWTTMYSVQISKYCQVKLGYENPVNSQLDDEEKREANSKNF